MILRAKHLMAHHWSIGEIEYTGITPIPISVKWHSFNQSSPQLSLSCPWLLLSHTFWPQSLTLPLPLLHLQSTKKLSGCSLLSPCSSCLSLLNGALSMISYRGIAPIRALTNPSMASYTGWLYTAFCLTMAFRKARSLRLSLYRKNIPYRVFQLSYSSLHLSSHR